MAATAEEEAIIKYRYLTQTVTTTANILPPFKSLARRFYQFKSSLKTGSVEESDAIYNDLLVDLHAIRAALDRQAVGARVATQEMMYYADEQAKLEASIDEMGHAIETQKEELEAARIQLEQWQEYETLKSQVAAVPARSVSRSEMEMANREIADLQMQGEEIDRMLERRKRMLKGILGVLAGAVSEIEADAPPEEGALPDAQPS